MKAAPWIRIALTCLSMVVAMFAVFTIVLSINPSHWRPVDAEVVAVRIEGTRLGSLDWSVLIDYTYEVGGSLLENRNLNVLHDADRAVVEARSNEWPVGRHFTIYVHPEDSRTVSLAADGGAQATAFVAALLTPLVLAFIILTTVSLRRSRSARRRASAR